MALIIEDGSIVAGAESYISAPDARTLALNWGIVLPEEDTDLEIALRKGAQYIGFSEERFTGTRVEETQALSWPREDATKYSVDVADNSIPSEVILAQVQAASVYGSGVDVRPLDTGRRVASEKLGGDIEIQYENKGTTDAVTITAAEDLLDPFYRSDSFLSFGVSRS